ncbi:hypothetical protein [Nesterenkonia sp. CF4.4]|uniref:hypothetical protein n=1 Tax=Nesterenkonia sp. CF4.4 TaxID=3373079 RepID=UPI003EE5CFA0
MDGRCTAGLIATAGLDVDEEEGLEWYWPPPAPINYRGHPERVSPAARVRPLMTFPRPAPWIVPSRITGAGGSRRVDYGGALAQEPGLSGQSLDEASLLADLERI